MSKLLTTTKTSAGRTVTVVFTGTLDISTIDQALNDLAEARAEARVDLASPGPRNAWNQLTKRTDKTLRLICRAGLTIFRWRLQGSAQAAWPLGPHGS